MSQIFVEYLLCKGFKDRDKGGEISHPSIVYNLVVNS